MDGTFSWDAQRPLRTETTEPDLAGLCERWLDELNDEERTRLRELIGQRIAGSDVSPDDRALAVALGAATGSADWTRVPVRDDMSIRMIERLTEVADQSWLIEAATMLSTRRADAPKKKLQEFPVHERNEISGRQPSSVG